MKEFNQKEEIKKLEKYVSENYLPTKQTKKPFYNFHKAWISDPFFRWLDKHPEFLDPKNITIKKVKE